MPRLSRVPTDSSATIALGRSQLRPTKRSDSIQAQTDVFGDPELDNDIVDERSVSPASYGSGSVAPSAYSRSASWSVQGGQGQNGNAAYGDDGARKIKGPPPPPPSRSKKPPPPPPMKRSALSSNEVPRY